MAVHLELTGPDGSTTRVVLARPVELGREDADVVVPDPAVSRRHVRLEPVPGAVVVTDLGSSNGTYVDGQRIAGPVRVGDGAVVGIGDTRLVVRMSVPSAAGGGQLEWIERDLVAVGSAPGSAGAESAKSMLDLGCRARRALAGIGSEPWGNPVTVNLVDPFPDPGDPSRLVTRGAVVDADDATVWMAVTPEAPPEDPHRALALVFGAALPSAREVEHLLEGYGLHLAGAPDPSPDTVAAMPGPIADLDPDWRAAVAPSFVRFLLAREGDATFRRLLAAPAGRFAETFSSLYGQSETALERAWQAEASAEPVRGRPGEFLRMSWRYLRPYRRQQAEVFALMLVALAFTATYPFVTRRLFDVAIPSGEMSQVLTLLGVLAVAFAVSLVGGLRQSYVGAWISSAVTRDLRSEMFARLQRVPDRWLARHPQGDVLSRMMSDVAQVEAGLSTAINAGAFQAVSLMVATVIMLTVNWVLGLVTLAGAPLVAVVYRRMQDGARTRSLAVQQDQSTVLGVAAENYYANPVVKVFRLAGLEEARFRRASDRLFRSELRLSLFGGLFGVSVNGIVTVLRLFIIGLGTWLIFEGHFTLGGLVAFLGVMGEVLSPVTGLITLGQSIQASMGALVRVDEVLDADTEPDGADLAALPPVQHGIRLSDVALSYTAERRALDGVSVTIPAGSRVAFVGPSGSGKSSILRVLMRLYEPDEGSYEVDGVDVTTRTLASLRAQMGVVFQDSFLFDATIRENIAHGTADASDEQIRAAADAAELDELIATLPRGWDTLVGEGGRSLSGGQRQRVAIARALVGDPPVLVLDEATSALDPATERQITSTLARVGAGRTVIAVTHRLASIADYDRIFVVVAGRIAEVGTHDDLLARRGVYARLWAEQTGAPLPPEPELDVAAVLARIPLFRPLDGAGLADVASRLQRRVLEDGELLGEGGGSLVIVETGQGEVLASAVDGAPVVRTVAPGAVFGLAALLGEPAESVLRAHGRVHLLELRPADLDALCARHPAVADARAGRGTMAAPARGRTLARSTLGTVAGTGSGITTAEVAAAVAAARATAKPVGPPPGSTP